MKTQASNQQADLTTLIQGSEPGKRTRLRIIVIVVLLLSLLGIALWWHLRSKAADRPAPYATEKLHRGDLSLVITATGNFEPTNQITVGSEISGLVQSVLVDINDRVTKGQSLAQIDTAKIRQQIASGRASLAMAKAGVAEAEATLKQKEADLARQQELQQLSGGRLPSKADLDNVIAAADSARAGVQSAEATVAAAEATLAISEDDLSKSIIKSPVDGIVLTRSVDPGQTVAASLSSPELFVIAEKLERMKLTITVAEADIGRVIPGLDATFTVDAWPDRIYEATVKRVSYASTTNNNVVTYETDLEVANDDLSLRPGMTATADIKVAESKNVFLVPSAALRFNPASAAATSGAQQKSFIQSIVPTPRRRTQGNRPSTDDDRLAPGTGRLYVLRNGKPEAIIVKIGLTDGRSTEVSGDGLAEDLPIILRVNASQS